MGFSLQWLLLLQIMGSRLWASVVVAHGLSFPGALGSARTRDRTHVPALAGGFLTTGPPEWGCTVTKALCVPILGRKG